MVPTSDSMASEAFFASHGESSDELHTARGEPSNRPEKMHADVSLAEKFDPTRQSWRLFREQAFRLLLTLTLLALYIMTLVVFQSYDNVSHEYKIWYNTVATIINLALGLNFLEAFKDMAKVLRWRVLANRRFTVREADLIMSGDSLLKLGRLMWVSRTKPLTLLVCTIWIALNLLAQGSIALISLNASMDSGTDSSGAYNTSGTVKAARLDCFYNGGQHCPVLPGPPLTSANTLGQAVQGQERCPYQDDDDITNAPQSCVYFFGNDTKQGEFAYRFSEFNPLDAVEAYPHFTNRNIRAFSGQCYQYPVDWDNSPVISDQDGTDDVQLFKFGNDSYTAYLPIPKNQGAFESTTYVYNGTSPPQNATAITCGPRCITMYVLRLGNNGSDPATAIFECPVTISTVNNATAGYHNVPDSVALIAASAISLSGRNAIEDGVLSWRQFHLYTFGNYWETGGHTAQQVGLNVAEFAIASLASMANLNPKQLVPGTLPILGYHLDVQWVYVIILAVCIGVVHFLLVVLNIWIARPVIILDDSNLAVARLLHGLVGRLDGRGSLLDGKKLAAEIQAAGSKGGKIVYGVSDGEGGGGGVGDRVLRLDEGIQVRKRLVGGAFPRGEYA